MVTKVKRPQSSSVTQRVASGDANFDFSSISGSAATLQHVEFKYIPTSEEGDRDNEIACQVGLYVSRENTNIGFCEFIVTRKDKDKIIAEITARYLFIVESDLTSDPIIKRKILELFAKLSLWPRFKGLFNLINSQSDAEFPKLPMNVPGIKYVDLKASKKRSAKKADD